MTFKKLVEMITNISTYDDFNVTCGAIDMSFQREKITWKDHEMLYDLAALVLRGIN